MLFRTIGIVCILWYANDLSLFAQQAASSTAQLIPVAPDTSPVLYTLAGDPNRRYAANDTMPDFAFRMYDPARSGPVDAAHLGNVGSASRPLWFQPLPRIGFATGLRPFHLYKTDPGQLAFYRHSRTYSHAYFSRGRTQKDGMSWIKLSRTFSKGLNVSLLYKTFNNEGEYRHQRVKHGTLVAGVWWPVRDNYEVFLTLASNTFRQEDSGGIQDPEFFGSVFYDGPVSVPVTLSSETAKSKQIFRDLQLNQYFVMGKFKGNTLRAGHQLNLQSESWKFSDPNVATADQSVEQAFYGDLLTDTRGLRHYLFLQRMDNRFSLHTLRKNKKGQEAGNVHAGIRHSVIQLDQEPQSDSTIHNLFLTGGITLRPAGGFSWENTGDLGLGANTGEYRVQSTLGIRLGRAGQLDAGLLSQRRPADLIAGSLYSTGRAVWHYDWNKVIENTLSATYTLPKIGFSVQAQSHLVNGFLYFDATGHPQQTNEPVQVNQLLVQQNIHLGPFRSENSAGLQQNNRSGVLRLPEWFTKNSLYYSGHLFKKQLLLNTGVDFRINSAFTPDAYQPFLGQFHLQDSIRQAPYPWLDAFVAIKIQTFRFFFRMENLAPYWNSDATQNLYYTAWHPQNRTSFRIGISWRFMDDNVTTPGGSNTNTGNSSGPPLGRNY